MSKNWSPVPDYKRARLIELATKPPHLRVYVDQIAERLGLTETYVIRYCRSQGVEPPFRPRWSWKNWIENAQRQDRLAGKKSGRRPPSYRRLPKSNPTT